MSLELYLPHVTKSILSKYQFHLTKGLGQNFLVDGHIIDKITTASKLSSEDEILEIGPGIGTLTQQLAKKAEKVVAIEIDQALKVIHKETLPEKNITILYHDFLKMNLQQLFSDHFKGLNVKVIANIPYYITTPIIMKILEEKIPVKSITVMVQKEVADRFAASPGTKTYGAISAVVQYYCQVEIPFIVPKTVFIPQPKVDSAVMILSPHHEPPVDVTNETLFFDIIKGAFSQRRKTFVNAVSSSVPTLKKDDLIDALEKLGYNPAIRGEKLSIHDFATITNYFNS